VEETIAGIRTFYIKTGHGEKNLVFLHGWRTDHTSFLPVFEKIKDRYTIYAPDLPGFGKTDEPGCVYDTDAYARFVHEFICRLGITDPVIIGHSNGGRIAIALTRMLDIKKMILIGSTGIKPSRSLRYYIKVYGYKTIKKILPLFGKKGREYLVKYKKSRGSEDYRFVSDRMKAVMSRLVNEDLRKYMPYIKTSTLLFWGENDRAVPLSDAKIMLGLIKDSGLVTVKGGGHYAYLDDVGLFVRVLDKFVGE
jgi:pimeloyl-ACP methyl ester carboxylesterase